jgi:hypothetical protein
MSIQKFYTNAAQKDFARVFQFRLRFFNNVAFDENHLTYVETAALPGRSITNVPVPYMGLSFNVPGTVSYPGSAGYAITFRCDSDYDIRSALEAATFNAFDEATSTGDYSLPGSRSQIGMELLDKNMVPVRFYTLFGVYVQSLADTGYDIKDTGTVQTVNATIAYQFWRAGTPKTGSRPISTDAVVPNKQRGNPTINSWTGRTKLF